MADLRSYRGLNAYTKELTAFEKTSLSEPDKLVDDLIEAAEAKGHVLQEKSTLKGVVGTDLRRQIPPQMFAVVSSLAKLLEQVESGEGKV